MKTLTPKKFINLYKKYGSIKEVWRKEFPDRSYGFVHRVYKLAVAEGLMPPLSTGAKTTEELKTPEIVFQGTVKAIDTPSLPVPKRGVKRYLFTSAQNDTQLFEPFWNNLLILKDHYNAELHISRFVYITNGLSAYGAKEWAYERAPKKKDYEEQDEPRLNWDERIYEYESDYRLEVAPGLVWCGEMNILPTASDPLSGLEVYSGRKSAIIPHVKFAMQSIPSSKHAPTKFNYTTGTVTQRNYIQRKAGLKAQFHHCYGALLVEVDNEGDWFVRQINADSEGTIFDLDIKVEEGVLTTGNAIEAITWGDIHVAEIEDWVRNLAFGNGGMLDVLQPRYQFLHDVLHFKAASHHELKHPHRRYKRAHTNETNVKAELIQVMNFLQQTLRENCETVIVPSNHHDHLGRWLQEVNGLEDLENAKIWLDLNRAFYSYVDKTGEEPEYLCLALRELGMNVDDFTFLNTDDEFIICEERGGGIECGMHGHLGPSGSRGSPKVLSKLGRKANVGHIHSASIVDGVYVSGTCGQLDPDWTSGPSSWSHSHILVYPNGKRTIVTMWNGKWKAE